MIRFSRPAFDRRNVLATVLLLSLGALGGGLADISGLPLPYMLGSLSTSALLVAFAPGALPADYRFPPYLRFAFIAAIGTLIGAQVDPAFVSRIPQMVPSLAGVVLFVGAAHGANYAIFRHFGGYDRATAFYCGTPGGLMESIALGEEAGADVRLLTLQHFLRIILVVTLVPTGLSLWHGEAVGSAGGMSLSHADAGFGSVPLFLAICAGGLLLGRGLKIPAGQLTGPLVVAAVVVGSGLATLDVPGPVLEVAQVVIGASLGARFAGVTRRLLSRALGLALATVGAMLVIGGMLALILWAATGENMEVLFISYAPGGVTEMGLIALSLAVNPAFVTFHHLARIALTVLEMSVVGRLMRPRAS